MLEWLKTILGDAYSDEIDKKVSEEIGKGFVARTDFNTAKAELKAAKDIIADRDKQLESLRKSTGDVDALKQQIATLQADNAKAAKDHEAEIKRLKIDTAVGLALSAARAKNAKAVRALLDLDKAELDEDGTVKGLSDQLKKLAAAPDSGFLFETGDKKNDFAGLKPGERSDGKPDGMSLEKLRAMSASERYDYATKHPEEYKTLYGGTS